MICFKVGFIVFNNNLSKVNNKSINVLFVSTDNDTSSGAFISMVTLIEILRDRYGINVFVILPNEGNGVELLNDMKIPFKIIKSWSWVIPISVKDSKVTKIKTLVKKILNVRAIKEISKVINEKDIDIVHINTTYSYVAAKAALKLNIPLVWHLREFLEQHQNNTLWDRESGNKLINKSDKIIVISDSLKGKYVNTFDKDKLTRIYDSVDDKFYKPNKEIFNSSNLIFIYVGRINRPKGQLDFAKACSKLFVSGFTNFEAWFVGDVESEDIENEIIACFESANMSNYKFLGRKNNVDELYEIVDISFTCSEFEAFGRTTIESMLSGNLVIGADSGATTELLTDNRGLLFKLHDSEDLFEKLKYAVDNPEISKKIAKSGRQYMIDNMGNEKNAEEVFNIYCEIINK